MLYQFCRGDYVVLSDILSPIGDPVIKQLYNENYGKIGLVRYASAMHSKAEVIFSDVPYISEVDVIYLKYIGRRKEWPLNTRQFPEPSMTITDRAIMGDQMPVATIIFDKELGVINEYCRFRDNSVTKISPDYLIEYGDPEIRKYYRVYDYILKRVGKLVDDEGNVYRKSYGFSPGSIYIDELDLARVTNTNTNSKKGESTMKNTNKKLAMPTPIKQVIFNGPATIVYWKDGGKTVVKCQEGAVNDPEKGFAMAVARHYFCDILGLSRYDGIFKKYLPKEKKEN